MSPYVRTVKTSSGATAVQIVYSSHRGSREIEHLGSAHSDAEVELLKAAARQRLAAGQGELDLGLQPAGAGPGGGPLPITSSRMGHLLDALEHAYRVLGLERAAAGDEVFRDLVLARIIEPSETITPMSAGRRATASWPARRSAGGRGTSRCAAAQTGAGRSGADRGTIRRRAGRRPVTRSAGR